VGDIEADHPGSRKTQAVHRTGVGRRLDDNCVAAADEGACQQVDRLLGTRRDQNLCGLGREAAQLVADGDRAAQGFEAEGVVTIVAESKLACPAAFLSAEITRSSASGDAFVRSIADALNGTVDDRRPEVELP
jgi:hypothetical protein